MQIALQLVRQGSSNEPPVAVVEAVVTDKAEAESVSASDNTTAVEEDSQVTAESVEGTSDKKVSETVLEAEIEPADEKTDSKVSN